MKCPNTFPFRAPNGSDLLFLGCGKCIACRLTKVSQWELRARAEWLTARSASFLTLTFSDENRPASGEFTLEPFQKFVRALRDKGQKPRYFVVGELGETTQREHFHALLFNYAPPITGRQSLADWPHGHVFAGTVTPASIGYVMSYLKHDDRKGPPPLKAQSLGFGRLGLMKIGFDQARAGRQWLEEPVSVQLDGRSFSLSRTSLRYLRDGYQLGGGTLPAPLPARARQALSVLSHMWRHDEVETDQVNAQFARVVGRSREREFSAANPSPFGRRRAA